MDVGKLESKEFKQIENAEIRVMVVSSECTFEYVAPILEAYL